MTHIDKLKAVQAALISANKQARSAPMQEPVAWGYIDEYGEVQKFKNPSAHKRAAYENFQILYTTPPTAQRPWVGLTDEERNKIRFDYLDYDERARAIEAKLKEKMQ
jgi:hypothetical protein